MKRYERLHRCGAEEAKRREYRERFIVPKEKGERDFNMDFFDRLVLTSQANESSVSAPKIRKDQNSTNAEPCVSTSSAKFTDVPLSPCHIGLLSNVAQNHNLQSRTQYQANSSETRILTSPTRPRPLGEKRGARGRPNKKEKKECREELIDRS